MDSLKNRRRILSAMVVLTEEKPLEEITEEEICEVAGVSRQVFHRTFDDKYAAALWYVNTTLEHTCRRIGTELDWRDAFLGFLRFIENCVEIMRWLEASRDTTVVHKMMLEQAYDDYASAYEGRHGKPMPYLIAYQARMFCLISTKAVDEWIVDECFPPAEDFIDLFLTLIPRELYEALDMESVGEGESPLMALTLAE